MIHVSARHGVVGVPYEQAIANLFPKGKRVTFESKPYLVLPHGHDTTRVLRNMGHDVPAPVLSQYDWNGGTPYAVQASTAALLTVYNRAYVLNGMGTGKTKCSLWSYDYLRKKKACKRMLVCAPLSTLNFVWAREIFATVPHRSCTVLHGDRKRRLKRLAEPHDVYIINPNGLAIIEDELKNRPDIDVFVIDELATFRNGQAAMTKCCKRIADRMKWVWGLTGSPTPNEPTDAWAQCRIITPETVDKRFTRFRDQTMVKVSQFKYVPKRDASDIVFSAMQPAVRYTLDDVVELPEVIERTIDIELGKKQSKIYEQMRVHAHAQIEAMDVTAVNAGAMLNKLLQISMGYVYTRKREIVELDNDIRLQALVDAIAATDRKVLVFCPFTHALRGIEKRLQKEGIDHRIVDGSTPRSKREEAFTLFQQTQKVKAIAAHPLTMSHGLTLTAADTVIWFGPTTSLETFEQANARVRRIGQGHKQQILMFQSTAAERHIYSRLRSKQKVQDNLLALFAEASLPTE